MVHFTDKKAWLNDIIANMSLKIRDQLIKHFFEVKILEIVLDASLRYHSHVVCVCKRDTKTVLRLKKLKNLRPETIHQLFSSTVAPFIDYASNI